MLCLPSCGTVLGNQGNDLGLWPQVAEALQLGPGKALRLTALSAVRVQVRGKTSHNLKHNSHKMQIEGTCECEGFARELGEGQRALSAAEGSAGLLDSLA